MPASSPGQQVEHADLEAVPLRPAHVHPHQHLGPVLRLGAAGAGMDGEQRVARVVGPLQHGLQLEGLDRAVERVGLARHLVLHGGVGLAPRAAGPSRGSPVSRPCRSSHGVTQPLSFLISWTDDAGAVGVGPEARLRLRGLEASAAGLPCRSGQRKSRSSVTRCCSSVRRSTRSAMPDTPGREVVERYDGETRGVRAWRTGARAGRIVPAPATVLTATATLLEDLPTAGEDLVQRFLEVRACCRPRPCRPAPRTPPSSSGSPPRTAP